jgi:outer membrane protein insertion porin family
MERCASASSLYGLTFEWLLARTAQTFQKNVVSCLSKPCISAGVGLIYRLDPIRVEVNMGIPLVASKSDGFRRGIQVGMGLEFL